MRLIAQRGLDGAIAQVEAWGMTPAAGTVTRPPDAAAEETSDKETD